MALQYQGVIQVRMTIRLGPCELWWFRLWKLVDWVEVNQRLGWSESEVGLRWIIGWVDVNQRLGWSEVCWSEVCCLSWVSYWDNFLVIFQMFNDSMASVLFSWSNIQSSSYLLSVEPSFGEISELGSSCHIEIFSI